MVDDFIKKKIYETVSNWSTSNNSYPVKLFRQLTYRCNLYFLFCENLQSREDGKSDYAKELRLYEWKMILEESRLGVRS